MERKSKKVAETGRKLEHIPALWIRNARKLIPDKLPENKRGLNFRIVELRVKEDEWSAQLLLQDESKLKIKGTEKIT
tara:strand:+ start:1485 stop:1715 length:231 start_codon:yes stop_codon:yes gene_type:complete